MDQVETPSSNLFQAGSRGSPGNQILPLSLQNRAVLLS